MFKYYLIKDLLSNEYFRLFFHGFFITVTISLFSIIFSLMLGFIVTLLRELNIKILNLILLCYVSLIRNTPLLIQLFFWYFIVGKIFPEAIMRWLYTTHKFYIFNIPLTWPSFEFLSGMFGLTFYSAAFIAEELKAGIYGININQKFAALSLGFSKWQTMFYIILPQAIKISKTPLLNQYMNIIKNSSLTMAIGVTELSYVSRQIESHSLQIFVAFAITTILYIFIISLIAIYDYKFQQNI